MDYQFICGLVFWYRTLALMLELSGFRLGIAGPPRTCSLARRCLGRFWASLAKSSCGKCELGRCKQHMPGDPKPLYTLNPERSRSQWQLGKFRNQPSCHLHSLSSSAGRSWRLRKHGHLDKQRRSDLKHSCSIAAACASARESREASYL